MTKTVKVPALAFTEIDIDAFAAECTKKFWPDAQPKFALKQVVMAISDFDRKLPCTILGIEARSGGWFYHAARPRWLDGVIEQVMFPEDKLEIIP